MPKVAAFNVSLKTVGGLSFLRIGRINLSWSVSKRLPVDHVWLEAAMASMLEETLIEDAFFDRLFWQVAESHYA